MNIKDVSLFDFTVGLKHMLSQLDVYGDKFLALNKCFNVYNSCENHLRQASIEELLNKETLETLLQDVVKSRTELGNMIIDIITTLYVDVRANWESN